MTQTNPMGTKNPCPLLKLKGTVNTRGVTAYDLLKAKPTLKVKRSQKEIQQANRPQFDHPKILHVLIDRANGFGCKTLARRHGGSPGIISTFCKSMGFGQIKPEEQLLSNGEKKGKSAQKIYEEEWIKEVRSTSKDVTWANHPSVGNWKVMKNYYADPDAHNAKCKEWRGRNKDKVAECNKVSGKRYRENNRERIAEYQKQYKIDNPEKVKENRRRQENKPINRVKRNLRQRLRKYIKADGAIWGGFGCTSDQLRDHLEDQFNKKMTWGNYGTYWHVDHIRPLASFDLFDQKQRDAANHYLNLQPLEAKENLKKSDSWNGQQTLALL